MSRAPLPYNPKILELFKNPKNLGKMEDATVVSVAGNPMCGDMITFYLKINEQDVIEKASFESYGCAANIATSSIVTEMIKGM
jgi:nitrogen fixation NifU-like protein